MEINGTHINYFFVCKRKLWLYSNGITFEHESELIAEGRFIHESSYQQRSERYKELQLGAIKIDYFDPKKKIVYEVKKSRKLEIAHIWQLKYYLYILKQAGMEDVVGILEYPKLRKRKKITLQEKDIEKIEKLTDLIRRIIKSPLVPDLETHSYCKSCSYYEFCYSGESEV